MTIALAPVGVVRSCFGEKFGIPRQPGLVPEAQAILHLLPPWDREEAVRGLEAFSHLWVVFLFHANGDHRPSPTVRPPRLGGNRRLGVFASRSPFRPNPIGLSAVRLLGIDLDREGVRLRLAGVDLLDGTPVLDIKPYLPYADSIPDARGGFADHPPAATLAVDFAQEVEDRLAAMGTPGHRLRELIARLLALDPRPAYLRTHAHRREFGMQLEGFDIRWRVQGECVTVLQVRPASPHHEPRRKPPRV